MYYLNKSYRLLFLGILFFLPILASARQKNSGTVTDKDSNPIGFFNQPLIVLDAIPIRNGDANYNSSSSGGGRIFANGIVDINPQDVESIDVLRGSDCTNGVVIITSADETFCTSAAFLRIFSTGGKARAERMILPSN